MEVLQQGSKTYVTDPDTQDERDFSYDYSFQSHSKDEQGIGDYATQDTVMDSLGMCWAPELTLRGGIGAHRPCRQHPSTSHWHPKHEWREYYCAG